MKVRSTVGNGDLNFGSVGFFAFVIIEWFGIVKRVDRIESKHRRILWINLAASSLGDSLMDLSARPLLVDRNVDLLSHPKNISLYQKRSLVL